MRRQLLPALGMLLVFTVITGLVYPLLVTGVAQVAFGDKADGSLVERRRRRSSARRSIGQPFAEPEYFHPRPAADGYVPGAQGGGTYSYGSNYGPTNESSARRRRGGWWRRTARRTASTPTRACPSTR